MRQQEGEQAFISNERRTDSLLRTPGTEEQTISDPVETKLQKKRKHAHKQNPFFHKNSTRFTYILGCHRPSTLFDLIIKILPSLI
jgi:hypothetical protein